MRRPAWTRRKSASPAAVPPHRGIGMGMAAMGCVDMRPRVITRDHQVKGVARDIAAIDDNIPERIRKAFRACDFDINYQVQMRFARNAERSKTSDAEVARIIGDIKTEADAQRFRKLWGSS